MEGFMIKNILMTVLVLALILLGAGIYLGHQGIGKLEDSYSVSIGKQNEVTKKLQEENSRINEDLKKANLDKVALEAELKKQTDLVASLLKQAQEAMIMEEQVKALNDKMQLTVESCQIKPKPVKSAVVVKKAPLAPKKVEERVVIKEVEKPVKPQTIVINKIFIQEGNKSKPKLIKQEKRVLPEAYPNDLLK